MPAPAAAVGYNTNTFNSTTTSANGGPWQLDNFYSQATNAGQVIQESDGSMTLPGTTGTQGGISTAHVDPSAPNNWTGIAFGGGAYMEATFSVSGSSPGNTSAGWPAWWASDIERAAYGNVSSKYPGVQWQGQTTGYQHYIELDMFEADVTSPEWGTTVHDWYGIDPTQTSITKALFPKTTNFGVSNLNSLNSYGVLWVPATATTQGYIKLYFNRVLVGTVATWNQYDASLPPTTAAGGGLAPGALYSVLDARHLFLILCNNNPALPMNVTNVQVWQASGADNLTQ